MKRFVKLVIFLFLLLISFSGGYALKNNTMPQIKTNPKQSYSVPINPKLKIASSATGLLFIGDFLTDVDATFLRIFNFADHPKLLKYLHYLDQNTSYIKTDPIQSPDYKEFYVLSNTYFDHGGLGSNYAMIYDPFDQKVLYETGGIFDQSRLKSVEILDSRELELQFIYGYTDMCTSCGLELFEFIVFDPGTATYISNNVKHKDVFTGVLEKLNKMKCISDVGKTGEGLSFDEIKNKYGENQECQFSNSDRLQNIFTPKKYFVIKDAVEKILNGTEVSISDLKI